MIEIRVSAAAEADVMEISKTTYDEFGFDAYLRYGRLIGIALRDLSADSQRNGTVPRPELGVGKELSPATQP
jgi:toxin ParE1/3/4